MDHASGFWVVETSSISESRYEVLLWPRTYHIDDSLISFRLVLTLLDGRETG